MCILCYFLAGQFAFVLTSYAADVAVMDDVLQYETPDPMLLYHTHLWHTLPLCVVLLNAALLSLLGSVGNDATLDLSLIHI